MAHLFLKSMLADCFVICVSWIPIMNRSLLKRSSMIALNLKTLLVRPLTLRVVIEIVCDVLSSEEDEITFANLGDMLFCTLIGRVEGKMPGGNYKIFRSLLRLLL